MPPRSRGDEDLPWSPSHPEPRPSSKRNYRKKRARGASTAGDIPQIEHKTDVQPVEQVQVASNLGLEPSRAPRGRPAVPLPSPGELQDLPEPEQARIARTMNNRASLKASKARKSQPKGAVVQTELQELRSANQELQAALTSKEAEVESLKAQLSLQGSEIIDNPMDSYSPITAPSAQVPSNSSDRAPPSHPDLPLFVSEPFEAPILSPPQMLDPHPAEPDLNTVLHWHYPGLNLPPAAFYRLNNNEEDPSLVFTPFAPATTPRESLFTPLGYEAHGSGGFTGGGAGDDNYHGNDQHAAGAGGALQQHREEFSAWRPTSDQGWTDEPKEDSVLAHELARMVSAPG